MTNISPQYVLRKYAEGGGQGVGISGREGTNLQRGCVNLRRAGCELDEGDGGGLNFH